MAGSVDMDVRAINTSHDRFGRVRLEDQRLSRHAEGAPGNDVTGCRLELNSAGRPEVKIVGRSSTTTIRHCDVASRRYQGNVIAVIKPTHRAQCDAIGVTDPRRTGRAHIWSHRCHGQDAAKRIVDCYFRTEYQVKVANSRVCRNCGQVGHRRFKGITRIAGIRRVVDDVVAMHLADQQVGLGIQSQRCDVICRAIDVDNLTASCRGL